MKILNVKLTKKSENIKNEILTSEISKSSKIKQLFLLGYDVKEISTFLNIRYNFSYNVISNYIITDSLEVDTTKQTSKKDLVVELFNQGKSNKEIAIELKTNYNYIYKITKELKDNKVLEETVETSIK